MDTISGYVALNRYEHALRHDHDRTPALVALCRWTLDNSLVELVFPALVAFVARNSTVSNTLLDAARAGVPELLRALNDADVESFDVAVVAGWSNGFPRGWMARVLTELESLNDGN